MSWYITGTVTSTNGSKAIVGVGTNWTASVNTGDSFSLVDANGAAIAPFYEIAGITDDTHLTLRQSYSGSSVSGAAYCITNHAAEQTSSALDRDVNALLNRLETSVAAAEKAKQWAVKMDGKVDNDDYSAKYYAAEAATDAATAQAIATQFGDLQTAITAAQTAQTAAETAQGAAETAKTAAQTAKTNAETAASTATTKASDAASSASSAADSATAAGNSESAAATSASSAATSETNAGTSEDNAATARTAAENARNESMLYASMSLANAASGENDQTFAEALLQQNLNTNNLYDRLEGGV